MRGRILIVDDHPVVLYGLRFLFESDPSFEICGEASDSLAARAQAEALKPDFVICDLVLGGRDGTELIQDLRSIAPQAHILVYSSQSQWTFARRSLQAGARGYIAKSEGLRMVAMALAQIARGDIYVGEEIRQRLTQSGLGTARDVPDIDELSNRELQVLQLIGEGRSGREIAEALNLSIKTIGTYRERLKVKLCLASLRELETLAREHVVGNRTQ
jgi:DNA-binding NarL/FixJ family response regulator